MATVSLDKVSKVYPNGLPAVPTSTWTWSRAS